MANRITIANNFMFGRVLCQEDICRGFLERVLVTEVGAVSYLNREQVLQPLATARGVRLDVYAETALGVIDVEMQANPHADLGRRLRYYQSCIDSGLLNFGASWRELRDSYIIFACDFDWPGAGLPVYTFDRLCRENPALAAETGSTWMVLNARAAALEPDPELRNLLEYLRSGSVAPDDKLVSAMDAEVSTANEDRKWVGSVMTVEDLLREAHADARVAGLAEGRAEGLAEGRAEGLAEGRAEGLTEGRAEGRVEGRVEGLTEGRTEGIARMASLAAKLAEEGRAADALTIMADPATAEALLQEYGL